MNLLEEIIAYKKIEIEKSKEKSPFDKLRKTIDRRCRDAINRVSTTKMKFAQTLKIKIDKKEIGLIAEIKKASPSKGIIKSDFNPIEIAKAYKAGGASCLSVLTDEKYFQGNLKYIQEIKSVEECRGMPILRKDFIIDPYQIYESIYHQADCILLIVAALDKNKLKELLELSCENKIDVLIEVHDERELEIVLDIIGTYHGMSLIGINNRDLRTFETNIETTMKLVEQYKRDLKDKIVVSESGIFSNKDIKALMKHNVYGFLVGEGLIKENDIEQATKLLLGKT